MGDQDGYSGYQDPVVLGDRPARTGIYIDNLGQPIVRGYHDPSSVCSPQPDEDPPGPCPPMFMDGYYGDRCLQTLPLRPLRSHSGRECVKTSDYPDIESDELSPLNRKNSKKQTDREEDAKTDIRRRPSSVSCYSNSSSLYKEGNFSGQRRVIPALHPHYFVTSPDEIS